MDKSQRMGYRRERGDVTMDTGLTEYTTAGPENSGGQMCGVRGVQYSISTTYSAVLVFFFFI